MTSIIKPHDYRSACKKLERANSAFPKYAGKLAISGSIASIITHLKPAARGDGKESALGPTTITVSASVRTEQKPSLLRRLKDLFGK